jgi:hypothetical protein
MTITETKTKFRKPTPQQKVRDEQIEYYLKVCEGHMPDLRLRIKRWKADYRTLYQLVDEDPDTSGWTELSRPMSKQEIYECLFALASLFARVEKIKWRRFLKAEQEHERRLWEENSPD